MPVAEPVKLLETLCALPRETEWLEFKVSHFDSDEVGRYVSALSNSAMLNNEARAYLIYGVEDEGHRIIGTTLSLKSELVGNEVFENWLTRSLEPRINLEFVEINYSGRMVNMIVIDPAFQHPVRFKHEAYIRIASVTKPLREYPERERALWAAVSRFAFEQGVAVSHMTRNDVLQAFHCDDLLRLLKRPPQSSDGVIGHLIAERLLIDDNQGGYDVTNLLALIAARDLNQFPALKAKAPRVICYQGSNKSVAISDEQGRRGYATMFPRLLKYVMDRVPQQEEMRHGTRVKEYMYPEIAIREFLANSLIHQDLTVTGASPLIEVFTDKIEITNPGSPLVEPDRFIDAPARSRNERLASLMRRLGYAEERGSGIDRAVEAIEAQALPPPLFRSVSSSTVITIYCQRVFAQMTRDDRLRACYQHACVKFLSGDPMRNATLRRRLGVSDSQYPQVSNVIRDAIADGLIKPLDSDQGNRLARYVPYWV